MAVWELALLIYAGTVLMVNVVSTVIMVAIMVKFKPIYDKSVKFMDKMMDEAAKDMF